MNSATQITAVAPAHAVGLVHVSVTGTGGISANTAADDYTYSVFQISGYVEGQIADAPFVMALPGAVVTVAIYATDPLYDSVTPANNVVGTAIADGSGNYTLNTASFRGAPLPLPTTVIISASAVGFKTTAQFGSYDRPSVVCSFMNFSGNSNRRLLEEDGFPANPPFEDLLPNALTAP